MVLMFLASAHSRPLLLGGLVGVLADPPLQIRQTKTNTAT
jgi:hypothetical protein